MQRSGIDTIKNAASPRIPSFYDTETSDDDCLDTFETLPKHTGCFAHTLQLVVRDGLSECGGHLKQIISNAFSIVRYVRKSINASDLLQDETRL